MEEIIGGLAKQRVDMIDIVWLLLDDPGASLPEWDGDLRMVTCGPELKSASLHASATLWVASEVRSVKVPWMQNDLYISVKSAIPVQTVALAGTNLHKVVFLSHSLSVQQEQSNKTPPLRPLYKVSDAQSFGTNYDSIFTLAISAHIERSQLYYLKALAPGWAARIIGRRAEEQSSSWNNS